MTEEKMIEAVADALLLEDVDLYPTESLRQRDYCLRLAQAALRAVREAQWQPIDSAPRDEYVLVCSASGSVYIAQLKEGDWRDVRGDYLYNPTHWMPLPPAPKEK